MFKKVVILVGFVLLFMSGIMAQTPVQVLLLAGQSNMAGAGNYDELDEAIQKRIEAVAQRVSISFNGESAKPLSYYNNKPSEKNNFTKRFGPELFMGLTLAEENPDTHFLLIKRSQGGTALYGAWNPEWSVEKAKEVEKGELKQAIKLYQLHLGDVKNNLKELKATRKSFEIVGLAWMQGENDAISEASAKSYGSNLKNLIHHYRTDLNVSKLPVAIGQINSRYGIPGGAEMVRNAMVNTVNQDCYAAIIKTSTDTAWADFPKHSDNVHYNTEGQKRLGIAFANAFFDLNKKLNILEKINNSSEIKNK